MSTTLECDGLPDGGCEKKIRAGTAKGARKIARGSGWHVGLPNNVDLCPEHRIRIPRPITVLDTPCIVWDGWTNADGYGRNGNGSVHRQEWERHNGPIPDGFVVMHLCDNPPCYNILHLRAGTQAENNEDKILKGRGVPLPTNGPDFWRNKTHCPKGHPYAGDNLRFVSGTSRRRCAECTRRKAKTSIGVRGTCSVCSRSVWINPHGNIGRHGDGRVPPPPTGTLWCTGYGQPPARAITSKPGGEYAWLGVTEAAEVS